MAGLAFSFLLGFAALVPRLLPQETAFLLRPRETVTRFIHATARKTRPCRRQRERASRKKRSASAISRRRRRRRRSPLCRRRRLPQFVPATAPPPPTRPEPAATMLVDAAAAQATWRRLERDARREREREKEKSSSAQLALPNDFFLCEAALFFLGQCLEKKKGVSRFRSLHSANVQISHQCRSRLGLERRRASRSSGGGARCVEKKE